METAILIAYLWIGSTGQVVTQEFETAFACMMALDEMSQDPLFQHGQCIDAFDGHVLGSVD